MPIIRILVDGYSLLHGWPELARGVPRHSHRAREALIQVLTQYRDMIGTPITIFFDGQGAPPGTPKLPSTPEMEILFSSAGKTADDLIERTTHRLKPYGDVLVVTDDYAERDTVINLGGFASSCDSFVAQVQASLRELDQDVRRYNQREGERYRKRR